MTYGGDMMSDVGLAAQLAEAQRELQLRYRVYPGLITRGNLTSVQADRQIALQQAIVATLQALCDDESEQLRLFHTREG